jgi:ubiquinone/menaquinone biosynthesis C-methylase UbiE
VEVVFKKAFAQSLPFPDAQFHAVLSTLMLHHLLPKARQEFAVEVRRVLKPGGRALAIDFGGSAAKHKGFLRHFHHRHGRVALQDIVGVLDEAGLKIVETGALGKWSLQFVVATAPGIDATDLINKEPHTKETQL